MQSSKQGKVTGMKAFKGNINGKELDGCTIFVEAKLKGESSRGYASQPYRWGKAENAEKIKHLEFPFVAEMVVEDVTDGRGASSQEIIDVRPVVASADNKKVA